MRQEQSIHPRASGSEFITATNTMAFSGGQDERDYSYIQRSDIQNAVNILVQRLTPQAITALNNKARKGEQIVTPLCNPRTTSNKNEGAQAASVIVSVTQTCSSVAYLTDSLNLVATRTLAQSSNLTEYQQVGTTQVTVNGSTYEQRTATLHVSLSGVWVYRFTQGELTQLTRHIAGESQEKATALLESVAGIVQVSIHLRRLDFKDQLPTDPQRINVQLFYMVS